MTNQNEQKMLEAGYQPRWNETGLPLKKTGLSYQPQHAETRGGYQPVANLTPQNSAVPLPPIPHGGSGESGRNGNKVSGKNGS